MFIERQTRLTGVPDVRRRVSMPTVDLEDLESLKKCVGREIGVTGWLSLTQERIEQFAGIALQRHFGGKRRIATVKLKINSFQPVKEGRILARSHLLRIGSTLCVGSVELTDDRRRAIGTAIVTYMLVDGPVTAPDAVFPFSKAGI